MAHVMVGRCISKTKFHELLGSWTLDFNCGGYYDGALSARTRRGITSLCRSTVLIIKGVRAGRALFRRFGGKIPRAQSHPESHPETHPKPTQTKPNHAKAQF